MKWHKFQDIVSKNPWILDRITGWLNLGSLDDLPSSNERRSAFINRGLKQVVREEIDFIAFRPFGSLDLSLGTTPYDQAEESHLPGRRSVQFTIFYHIEGELPHSRQEFVFPDRMVPWSVKDAIEKLHSSEGEVAFKEGKAFIVDCIVRDDVLSHQTGRGTISMQIYECPAGCGLNMTPPWRMPQPDPCLIAYLRGDVLPPLMPSPVAGQI